MARGAWWATVHGVAKSQTKQKQLSMNSHRQSFTYTKIIFCIKKKKHALNGYYIVFSQKTAVISCSMIPWPIFKLIFTGI